MPSLPTVNALYRYPLKGFSAEALDSAVLEPGGTMPFDRIFAIENGPSGFDPEAPAHLPKIRFLMLMRNEAIARLASRYDADTGRLTISEGGRDRIAGNLREADGRAMIEAWIAERFAGELRGPPRILASPGHSFSDKKEKVLHLINLASVRALEQKLGGTIDPMRFRANVVVDGLPPFAELEWVGRGLKLPSVTLSCIDRTDRCAATNVDPRTGARDMTLPKSLMGLYGHIDFGIYLTVTHGGTIAVGDTIAPGDFVDS
ncbi:MAG TPA: MOSC domain-containing protein [Afifellaceae bacterium]|nr:MOSC domain-containing protein [Afifellaceae bacterium]